MNMLKQPSHPRFVVTPTRAFLGILLSAVAVQGAELSVTHPTPIAVPVMGVANPYASTVQVADAAGLTTRVTIGLNISHTAPNDLDVLLVSPTGKKVLFMSDVGIGRDFVNCTFTFDDLAAVTVADSPVDLTNVVETVKPTNNLRACSTCSEIDLMPPPGPEGPYAANLQEFNGESPNGTWTLYVLDDENFDQGTINSWTLTITTDGESPDSPRIQVALGDPGKINLSWLGTAENFILQSSDAVAAPSVWTAVPGTPTLDDDKFVIELDTPVTSIFYRLFRP